MAAVDLEVVRARLLAAVDGDSAPLELSAFSVRGEPIGYAEAVRGDFAPIEVGAAWGPPWSTTWFHVQGQVPPTWAGRSVVAVFDLAFRATPASRARRWRGERAGLGAAWTRITRGCRSPKAGSISTWRPRQTPPRHSRGRSARRR